MLWLLLGFHFARPLGAQTASAIDVSLGHAAPSDAGPQRIVAMGPNSVEVLCALGAGDRIVGVSKFCVFPPELKKLPRVGGQFDPDLERIAALRPDLVVTRGQSDSIRRLCEVLKVPVYDDETDSLPGVEKCAIDLGFRLHREDRAIALVRTFRQEIASIRKDFEQTARRRVFLTVARQPDRLANVLTTGKGTFLDEMIDIAGGVNVFGHLDARYPQVSPEAILAQQPEVIIELMPELEPSAERQAAILAQWRQLGPLNAVAAGRVYVLTDENCLIPSPRFTAIIRKVAALLHPPAPDRP